MKQSAYNSFYANNLLGIKDQGIYELASAMLSTARATEGLPQGDFNFEHLKAMHKHLLQDLHEWAGTIRTTDKPSASTQTKHADIERLASKAISNFKSTPSSKMSNDEFAVKASICYANLIAISPFNDGNSRAIRSFLKEYAQNIGRDIKWENLQADKFQFAVDRALSGDISLLAMQFKESVISRDLFDEYNIDTVNNKTLEIAAFAGITPAALKDSAMSNTSLQSLAEDVTQRLVRDLELHSMGMPSKLDWDKSSIKYEVQQGSRNADILNSGIANVLSTTDQVAPEKKHGQRLG